MASKAQPCNIQTGFRLGFLSGRYIWIAGPVHGARSKPETWVWGRGCPARGRRGRTAYPRTSTR